MGVTAAWLPPGCKANDPKGNGYDCYDLWDLGEFDQKWTRSTKWGSREELGELVNKAKGLGVKVIWDAVLNHKTAGDETEECWAVEVDGSGTSLIPLFIHRREKKDEKKSGRKSRREGCRVVLSRKRADNFWTNKLTRDVDVTQIAES